MSDGWVTIDMPTDSDRSLTASQKGGKWEWGADGSPEEREQAVEEQLRREAEYRAWAYHAGATVGDGVKWGTQRAIADGTEKAIDTSKSFFSPVLASVGAGTLLLVVIGIHASVTWIRPVLNFITLRWIQRGQNASLVTSVSYDPSPLQKGDRVGEWVVTSPHGDRVHPVTGVWTFHKGVDVSAPAGIPLYAPDAGNIECLSGNGYGSYADAHWGQAGHLSECYPGYKQQGELFAKTGNSGALTTGAHLDARKKSNGQFVSPTRGFVETMLGISGGSFDVEERQQLAINYFLDQGFTPTATAYLVGSLKWESGLNPMASGDGGKALGLNQWWPDRRVGMPNTFEGQLAWVIHDMEADTASSGILEVMRNSSEANAIKTALQAWTRWGVLGDRWVYAEKILSTMQPQQQQQNFERLLRDIERI